MTKDVSGYRIILSAIGYWYYIAVPYLYTHICTYTITIISLSPVSVFMHINIIGIEAISFAMGLLYLGCYFTNI